MTRLALVLGVTAVLAMSASAATAREAKRLPAPASSPATAKGSEQTAVFGGGCFWGAQALFSHVRGVKTITAGYDGGGPATANYRQVETGTTGHVEAVELVYDPRIVSYAQLLEVFLSVAVDPTEAQGQFPDKGPQYQAVIFYNSPQRQAMASAYIRQLDTARAFDRPIAVQLRADKGFFPAEDFHQNYAELHPASPYVLAYDKPRIQALRTLFPELYVAR